MFVYSQCKMPDYKTICSLIDTKPAEAQAQIQRLLEQDSRVFSLAELCLTYHVQNHNPIDPRTQIGSYIVDRLKEIINQKEDAIMTRSPFLDPPSEEYRELTHMLLLYHESHTQGHKETVEVEEPTV